MTEAGRTYPLRIVTVLAAVVVISVLLWNYLIMFHGDILGFYRIGTVLPHSPYVATSPGVLAQGEVGYDGQLFLSIAMDPSLAHPETLASLDNPRYRYRRILFPVLGYVLSLGQRPVVPFTLVLINAACLIALVSVLGMAFHARQLPAWGALFVLGIPGYWCVLLLTTADLLAALLLAGALASYQNERYRALAVCYGLAALTHETMVVVIGSLAIPLLARRQWRDTVTVLTGCIPALLWNGFVLWYIPPGGSTTGVAQNFGIPGMGIVDKAQAILAGPVSAKWLFDTSAFVLLCGTFCLLIISLCSTRRLHPLWPCALAYLGFFMLSRMPLLSYYIDFLRVYGNVILLLVISLHGSPWPRVTQAILLAWCGLSLAFVTAYSMQLI